MPRPSSSGAVRGPGTSVHADDDVEASIARAVTALSAGDVVAFPTETVYGLGADARNASAVARIFRMKGRPLDHPVIVHLATPAALTRWARPTADALRLVGAFWPGPLTLILPRADGVLDAVTGGQSTVGLRCPDHPVALRLLQACAAVGIDGVAAPSANRFGHVSPTTAAHVRGEFGAALLILEGGAAMVGIESTIVDLSGSAPRILRPGMIGAAAIEAVLARPLSTGTDPAPRVSGSLAAHYAPLRPLELVSAATLKSRLAESRHGVGGVAVLAYSPTASVAAGTHWLAMPAEPDAYARVLYARLREADQLDVARILVEVPPDDIGWLALHDRLRRAAAGSGGTHGADARERD